MLKKRILVVSLLFLSSPLFANASPDIIRERQGLEVISMQLQKLNELARHIQQSADPHARIQFNYSEFERQTETLRREVNDYLYQPLKPQPQSVIDTKFTG